MFVRLGGMIHGNEREGHLAAGQSLVVGEMDSQLALQGRNRGGLQLGVEFVLEGLEQGVAPHPAHRGIGQNLQRLAGVRDGHNHHSVFGQQLLRGRFGGDGGPGAQQQGREP